MAYAAFCRIRPSECQVGMILAKRSGMTQINFGNISTVGNKNVFLGSQSGLNIEGLITSLTTAKRLPAVKLEKSVSTNNSKIAALSQMKSSLNALKEKLNALRNPTGFSSAGQNVFDARSSFTSISNGATASNYLGVTTNNSAPIGKYDIQILNLAKSDAFQSISFSSRTESVVQAIDGEDDGMFTAGSFTLSGGADKDAIIQIREGASLTDIAAEINAVSSITSISATIVKISDDSYKLTLNHKITGSGNDITITDPDNVMPVDGGFTEIQNSSDAVIVFNEQVITRSSNTITDILDNVTLTLYQTTGSDQLTAEKITLDIDKNSQTVATGIADMLIAYNTLRDFYANQTATDGNGNYLDTAVLNGNTTMKTIIDRMASHISGNAAGTNNPFVASTSAPTNMGGLGIYLTNIPAVLDAEEPYPEVKSVLDVDVAKLTGKLDQYFEEIRKIFEFQFSSNSSRLNILERDNTITSSRFTIVVNKNQPEGSQAWITHIDGMALASPAYLDYDSATQKITGKAGTGLQGLSLSYSGNGNSTFDIVNDEFEKKFSLTVNSSLPKTLRAQVTKMFGYDLATPMSMAYNASGSYATIKGTGALSGLEMLYTGNGMDEINVAMSQGIADKMFNDLEAMVADTEGMIDIEIKSLQDANAELEKSIERIDTQIEDYRDKMLDRFSALEAAIASANQLLALLDAQTAAMERR